MIVNSFNEILEYAFQFILWIFYVKKYIETTNIADIFLKKIMTRNETWGKLLVYLNVIALVHSDFSKFSVNIS